MKLSRKNFVILLGILLLSAFLVLGLHAKTSCVTASSSDVHNATATNANMVESSDSTFASVQLKEIFTSVGFNLEDITAEQLLVVQPSGTKAMVYCYEKTDATWEILRSATPAFIGKNGVSSHKEEGDGTTPVGVFSLLYAFGLENEPSLKMPYRQITTESYWVDDSNSSFYNQWVEGTFQKDWASAEHLSEYVKQYALGLVIDYNMHPVIPGLGSAIFFHCGDCPTAGCIAVSHESMLHLLGWLDEEKHPAIVIMHGSDYVP